MEAEEGDTEDNILRMEILDGLYEYERSSDELLRQVKKAQRELTRKASSRSWMASTSTRGHTMNFFARYKKHRGDLTRSASSGRRSWTASTCTRGHPINFFDR
jgi:hypothetical protein